MFTISRRIARVFASFSAWTSSISSADRPFMSSISSSAPILPLWKMKEKAIYYQVILSKNSFSLSNYYLDDLSSHPTRHKKCLSTVCLQNWVFILFFPLGPEKKKKKRRCYLHISGTVNNFWTFVTSLNHIQWGILNSFIYSPLTLNISQMSTHF